MKKTTPCKAINSFCKECVKAKRGDPANCINDRCPLFPYRLSKNPNRRGVGGRNLEER